MQAQVMRHLVRFRDSHRKKHTHTHTHTLGTTPLKTCMINAAKIGPLWKEQLQWTHTLPPALRCRTMIGAALSKATSRRDTKQTGTVQDSMPSGY